MSIRIGDRLPSTILKKVTQNGSENINVATLFHGKTVALFAVPGAFTPVCTSTHLPGVNAKMDQFKSKGVEVICLSVNDPFVMEAWAKSTNADPDITFLADWNAEFTKAVGLTLDGSSAGLGVRSLRYSMVVKDGIVTALNVEDAPKNCDVSSADRTLETL